MKINRTTFFCSSHGSCLTNHLRNRYYLIVVEWFVKHEPRQKTVYDRVNIQNKKRGYKK
jgi:hypothetical protein